MKSINLWIGKINKALVFLSALCLTFLFLLTVCNVIGRYFLLKPISPTYELTTLVMAPIVFLSVAHVQQEKGHVTITMLDDMLSAKFKPALNLFRLLLQLATAGYLLYAVIPVVRFSFRTNERLMSGLRGLLVWPSKLTVAIGWTLVCVVLLLQIIQEIASISHASAEKEE